MSPATAYAAAAAPAGPATAIAARAEKVAIGMLGLFVMYLFRFVLNLMGVPLGATMDTGVFGFVVNAVAIGLAISCLFIDFAEIESARRTRLRRA